MGVNIKIKVLKAEHMAIEITISLSWKF